MSSTTPSRHLWSLLVALCVLAVVACDDGESGETPDTTAADTTIGDTGVEPDTAEPTDTVEPGDTAVSDAGADTVEPGDTVADTTGDTDTSEPDWGFDALVAEYGLLSTIAGKGDIQDKAVNGWVGSYEGGPAIDAELSRPHIALADDAGNVYIADKDAHAVRRIALDGTITTVAGTGTPGSDGDAPAPAATSRLSAPNGLWVRGDGTLYVLDLGNDRVRRIDTDGQMTTLFTIGGAGAGRGLWVADDESMAWVAAGSALKRWTPDGGVETVATGYVSLGNLHATNDGRSVVYTDRDGHRVYRIDDDAAPVVVAGNGTPTGGADGDPATGIGLDEVRGVWIHPRGGLLLCTHKGGDVWFVDPQGVARILVHGDDDSDTHAGDGLAVTVPGNKISEPRAVTMTPAGDLLITENDYGFVRRLAREP